MHGLLTETDDEELIRMQKGLYGRDRAIVYGVRLLGRMEAVLQQISDRLEHIEAIFQDQQNRSDGRERQSFSVPIQ